jgi:hypothetical protein
MFLAEGGVKPDHCLRKRGGAAAAKSFAPDRNKKERGRWL